MADEFTLTRNDAGETNYVVIRRVSDSYAWDNAASGWETYDAGSWDDYDIPLTDDGGGLYTGDMPGSIAAGTRLVIFYFNQVGGTPDVSDTLLITVDATWNGSGLTGNAEVTLSARALTTLESVKRAVNLVNDASEDTLLTELINIVSRRIEDRLGRRIAASNYVEVFEGCGNVPIQVRNYPIVRVMWLRYSLNYALNVSYGGSDIAASVGVEYDEEGVNGAVHVRSIAADGTETTNTLDFATYPTLSTLATAITALSGWTATKVPSGDAPADSLMALAGRDAKSETAQVQYFEDFDFDLRTKPREGQIVVRAVGVVQVKYRGGYETVPDGIVGVANDMVQRAFALRDTNQAVQSESIPDYSYSLASKVQLTADDAAVLEPYMNYGVG